MENLRTLYSATADALHRTSERIFAVTIQVVAFDLVIASAALAAPLDLTRFGQATTAAIVLMMNSVAVHYIWRRADAFGRREDELFAIRAELLQSHDEVAAGFHDDHEEQPARWWFIVAIVVACAVTILAVFAPSALVAVAESVASNA